MSNVQAMCTSFKVESWLGQHQLGAATLTSRGSLTSPTKDTVKAALYLATASLGAATTAYSATGEVTGTGYSAGGVTVTNATDPTSSGTTAIWTPSASIVFSERDAVDRVRRRAALQLDAEQQGDQRPHVRVADDHRRHVHLDYADQ
jgi:hypothetical protein